MLDEMEGDEINAVLSRVSELGLKITSCIQHKSISNSDENETEHSTSHCLPESESLFSIRDALDSLQQVLLSLQVLQRQQRYEREATLAEIDHSRHILLQKIKDYKGDDLEVLHEVSAFASETVEHDGDLLLPPYPSHPHPLILDKGFSSNFSSIQSLSRNGVIGLEKTRKEKKVTEELERTESPGRNSPKGMRIILSAVAKTVLGIVGAVTILGLAGFEPRVRMRNLKFGVLDMFQKQGADRNVSIQCPPGKVLVMENGEPRCLVKERTEVPFEPVTTPDVSYGCG